MKTIVYLRSMEVPAVHWEEEVLYDAWGSPYIAGETRSTNPATCEQALFPDGTTSDTCLFGTEWRHKSGPEIVWPDKPDKPFP